MSTLKADTIQSTSGGATTLTKQSAAKVFCNLDGTGTVAIRKSLNVSSIADDGTGLYDVNFTNSFADTVVCHTTGKQLNLDGGTDTANDNIRNLTYSASMIGLFCRSFSGSMSDAEAMHVTSLGDLA